MRHDENGSGTDELLPLSSEPPMSKRLNFAEWTTDIFHSDGSESSSLRSKAGSGFRLPMGACGLFRFAARLIAQRDPIPVSTEDLILEAQALRSENMTGLVVGRQSTDFSRAFRNASC